MEDHGDSSGQGNGEEGANMSQSELEDLQRKNCVFCHIASGKVPAKKVYEDSECVAVFDINPANQGHMLLMPKEHYTVMFQLPELLLDHIFLIAKGLSQAGLKAFQSRGTTIFAANGVAAGQRAPHFMLHIIPRTSGDSVGLYIPSRAFPEKESVQIAAALTAALGGKKQDENRLASEEKHGSSGSENTKKEEANKSKKEGAAAEKDSRKPAVEKKADKLADLDSLTDFLTKGRSKGGGK